MTSIHPLDPDDALTIDGTDLVEEIRAAQAAGEICPIRSPVSNGCESLADVTVDEAELTIDGGDLVDELRRSRLVAVARPPATWSLEQLAEDETDPTENRWRPPTAPLDDVVDTTGLEDPMSRPQRIALVAALIIGLGAAAIVFFAAGADSMDPSPAGHQEPTAERSATSP